MAQDWRTPEGTCFTPLLPGRFRLRIGRVRDSRGFGEVLPDCRTSRCTAVNLRMKLRVGHMVDNVRLNRGRLVGQRSPLPYEPGTGCYLDDVDWEVESRTYETRRPGYMDFNDLCARRTNLCRSQHRGGTQNDRFMPSLVKTYL